MLTIVLNLLHYIGLSLEYKPNQYSIFTINPTMAIGNRRKLLGNNQTLGIASSVVYGSCLKQGKAFVLFIFSLTTILNGRLCRPAF